MRSITLWTYLSYGRPPVPRHREDVQFHRAHSTSHATDRDETQIHNHRGSDEGKAELAESEPQKSHVSGSHGEGHHHAGGHQHDEGHQHGSSERPMFATISVAVCHCGAGCVLGDIIGEWLVYGGGAVINGRALWAKYLVSR